jgi:ADP-heptose:LPS heptosyltransferase
LVDRFISYQFHNSISRKIFTALRLWVQLWRLRFAVVVSLLPSQRSAKSLARDVFFFRLCGIRRHVGFSAIPEAELQPRDSRGARLRTRQESRLRLSRLERSGIALAESESYRQPLVEVPQSERLAVDRWLTAWRRKPERTLVAICPGCKQPANAWHLSNFLEIGRRLIAAREFELIVVGGPAERGAAEQLTKSWGEGLMAAGEFSVMGSAAILQRCQFMIGLDTGTSHLAAGVGTACVVVQGARTVPGMWDPLGPGHTVIRKQVNCEACHEFKCPKPDHPCMSMITVDEVWSAVETLRLNKHHTFSVLDHAGA